MLNKVCIWDLSDSLDKSRSDIVAWNTFTIGNDQLSVPQYLEKNSERLRSKYLAFIYELSHSVIDGKSLLEHFEIDDQFSFWWMTKIAEKSPFKSPRIYDCLRIIALEELIQDHRFTEITLESSDAELAETIQHLCLVLNVRFTWRKNPTPISFTLRGLYESLPYPIRGILSLRHLVARWKLKNTKKINWFNGGDAILICSYFFNLKSTNKDDEFYSNQWGDLPGHLMGGGYHLNWIQHYLPSPSIPDVKSALGKMDSFNYAPNKEEIHSFLDGFLSARIIFRVFNKWLKKSLLNWMFLNISESFKIKGSAVWLWPLLKHDWKSSITGSDAMISWIWLELFDTALAEIPKQQLGFYLWENQAWEMAFLRAWQKHGHGKAIGVPHATICFWHLNNFEDLRTYTEKILYLKPFPNYLAINGLKAWSQFLDAGYPKLQMKQVEALRFSYLERIEFTFSRKQNRQTSFALDQGKQLLLLGDFTLAHTLKMLDCIRGASEILGHQIAVTVKPHPVCEINQAQYPYITFEISEEPICNLLKEFDVVLVSNTSSAGLEAFLSGLSVAVYIDGDDFNHSPLKGLLEVSFVTNPRELVYFLATQMNDEVIPQVDNYFWLDSHLGRWSNLISDVKSL